MLTEPEKKDDSQQRKVSEEFTRAIRANIAIQAGGVILGLLILDCYATLQFWLVACSLYWIGVVIIRLRRPFNPTVFEMVYVTFGALFCFAFIYVFVYWGLGILIFKFFRP